jgi:hypothetical protein
VPDVDIRGEIGELLTSRRARITPGQAGLRIYGNGLRRVPGLNKELLDLSHQILELTKAVHQATGAQDLPR